MGFGGSVDFCALAFLGPFWRLALTLSALAAILFDVRLSCRGQRPGLGPAADLLSFASPKESRQRKGDPTCRVPCASLRGNLRCSVMGRRCGTHFAAAQRRSNNRSKLEHEAEGMLRCPQPAPRPALLGTSRGDRSPIRAIAALGLGAGVCGWRPSSYLLLRPPSILALPTCASPSGTLKSSTRVWAGSVRCG